MKVVSRYKIEFWSSFFLTYFNWNSSWAVVAIQFSISCNYKNLQSVTDVESNADANKIIKLTFDAA